MIRDELSTADWSDVFRQGARLGALQVHLSGGEPAARHDLPELISAARGADLYVNLITAGTLLDRSKLDDFRSRGLDHIQLSIQDIDPEAAQMVAGARVFEKKLEAARLIRAAGFPMTLNVVLSRFNIGRVAELTAMAIESGAERLELANTQYYAWAEQNRAALLPSREQYEAAEHAVREARERYRGRLEIAFVRSDYISGEAKACMGGWANSYVCITPSGDVLPCHAARVIVGLRFDNIRELPLAGIWHGSAALNAFRGNEWMAEPCQSCPKKAMDFGGCRCQAFMLTGDALAADPACRLSPAHDQIVAAVSEQNRPPAAHVYRDTRNSRRLANARMISNGSDF